MGAGGLSRDGWHCRFAMPCARYESGWLRSCKGSGRQLEVESVPSPDARRAAAGVVPRPCAAGATRVQREVPARGTLLA